MPTTPSLPVFAALGSVALLLLAGCASGNAGSSPGGGSAGADSLHVICEEPAVEGETAHDISAAEFATATGVELPGTPACIAHAGTSDAIDSYTVAYGTDDVTLVDALFENAQAGGWAANVEPATSDSGTYADLFLNGGTFQIHYVPDFAVDRPGQGISGPGIWVGVAVPQP